MRIQLIVFGVLLVPLVWIGAVFFTVAGPWLVILSIGISLFYPVKLVLDSYASHRIQSPYWKHAARLPFTLLSISYFLYSYLHYPDIFLVILLFFLLIAIEMDLLCQLFLKPKLVARFPEKAGYEKTKGEN